MVCTELNGFKYCYLTLVILFKIIHLLVYHRKWTQGQSGPGSNGNEGVLHTF